MDLADAMTLDAMSLEDVPGVKLLGIVIGMIILWAAIKRMLRR
jgi:hypothetical protein